MSSISKELAELLVDNGLLSDADLEQVAQEKEKTGEPLRIILERLNLATEKQLKNTLELQYGVNYLALHTISPELPTVDLLPNEVIREYRIVPIHVDGNRLTVAMVNPDSSAAMKAIKAAVDLDIKALVCFEDDFEIFLDQIEKMRHMPDRPVAPVDDSEFASGEEIESQFDEPLEEQFEEQPATYAEEDLSTASGSADDTADDTDAAPGELVEHSDGTTHESAEGVDFHEPVQEYAGAENLSDEITSDSVAQSPSLTSGSFSAQYDTGSLDSIATPRVSSNDLDSIPTPKFDASELDAIPGPKAETSANAAPSAPPEKPQPSGIGALFRGGAPRKAASDPSQEKSGNLSALRGMMGGKKGGKKTEPAAPPPPPPPPPPPVAAEPGANNSTASGDDDPPSRSGLLSSKLGSAAHSGQSAKKFFKEKRSDSQPISIPEANAEEAVPDWMNQIDENTPLPGNSAEQTSDVVPEYGEPITDSVTDLQTEQAVSEYYEELGFDTSAESSPVEQAEQTVDSQPAEPEVVDDLPAAPAYEAPPMDPSAANFMSWTEEDTVTAGESVSNALDEAYEAMAASSSAAEEALADAEDAWEEASAAAEEAVTSGELVVESPVAEQTADESSAGEIEAQTVDEEIAPQYVQEEVALQDDLAELGVDEFAQEEGAPQEEIQEIPEEVTVSEAPDAGDIESIESADLVEASESITQDGWGEDEAPAIAEQAFQGVSEQGQEEAAALLDEIADLADVLTGGAQEGETIQADDLAELENHAIAEATEITAIEPIVAENIDTPSAIPVAAVNATDEFDINDSEFLSGIEEVQAMANLTFGELEVVSVPESLEADEFADIQDWGEEPAVENLMSSLSTAAADERASETLKEGLEPPPFLQEDLLQEMGVVSAEQIPAIRREMFTSGESLSTVLERMGIAGEMELSDAFDMQFGAGYVTLASMKIDAEVLNLLPAKVVVQRKVLPITKTGNRVVVAMINPDDLAAMNDIKFRLKGMEIKKAVCLEDDFEHFLRTHLIQSNGEAHFETSPPVLPVEGIAINGAAPESLPAELASNASPEVAATSVASPVLPLEAVAPQSSASVSTTPLTPATPAPVAPTPTPPAPPAPALAPTPPPTPTPPPAPPESVAPAAIPTVAPVQPPAPSAPLKAPTIPPIPPGIAALAKPAQPASPVPVPVSNPPAVPAPQPATPVAPPAIPARPVLQSTLHEIPAQKPPVAPASASSAPPPAPPAGMVPPKPLSPQQIPSANVPRVNVPPASQVPTMPQSPVNPPAPPAAKPSAAPAAPSAPAAPQAQLPPGQAQRVQPAGLVAPPAPQTLAPTSPVQQPAIAAPSPHMQPVPQTPPQVPAAPPPQPAVVRPAPQVQPPQPAPAAPPAANVQPSPQSAAPPQPPSAPAPMPQLPAQTQPAAQVQPTTPPVSPPPSIPPGSIPRAVTPPQPLQPAAPGVAMPRINPSQIPGLRAQQSGSNPAIPAIPGQVAQPASAAPVQPAAPQAPVLPQPAAIPVAPAVPPTAPVPAAPAPAIPAVPVPPAPPAPPPLDANLLALARDIINKAADNGFSDVHIEPQATELELRYWYDGALIEATKLEKHIHGELIRCYKSIAGLSMEETKKPQDRRLKWTDTGAELDIRITTIPSEHGEMVAVSIKFEEE